MKKFLAYFDVLGFKGIVKNNTLEELDKIFSNLLRDTQLAGSEGRLTLSQDSCYAIPDEEELKVNCLHVSDSILFWTEEDSNGEFIKLIEVCRRLYESSLKTTVPLRGCIVYGEIKYGPFRYGSNKDKEVKFYNSSMYGKGFVEAYSKADQINYAGCYIDKSAIDKAGEETISNLVKDKMVCYYKVPLKDNRHSYEHVIRPTKSTYNERSFMNAAKCIETRFSYYSKVEITNLPDGVKTKLNNTIDFLEHFRERLDSSD